MYFFIGVRAAFRSLQGWAPISLYILHASSVLNVGHQMGHSVRLMGKGAIRSARKDFWMRPRHEHINSADGGQFQRRQQEGFWDRDDGERAEI